MKLNNIQKLYWIQAFKGLTLVLPVLVLIFQKNGLSMQQIFWLQSIFAVATILLEIPTGYFADRYGQKIALLAGSMLSSIGFAIYSVTEGFFGLACGEIVLGMGMSFASGADSALLYNILIQEERAKENKKISGNMLAIHHALEGIAQIIGALLAMISLKLPLYCDIVIPLLAIPFIAAISEPIMQKPTSRHSWKNSLNPQNMRALFAQHIEMIGIMLYAAITDTSTYILFWFTQPYFQRIEIPIGYFGVIMTALLFVCAFFSREAHRVERLLGEHATILLFAILPFVGYMLIATFQSAWSIAFFALFYISRGLNDTLMRDRLQKLASSHLRSTILSLQSFVWRCIAGIVGPIAGWVHDAYSLETALYASGTFFFITSLIAFAFMVKAQKK